MSSKSQGVPVGAPSFIEMGVPSGAEARGFFADLFGWTFHEMGGENCWAETPTLRVGVHAEDDTRTLVVYFAVADIDAAAARVRALGGEAPAPGPETAGFGRFVECRDRQGMRFGLHQPPRG